MNFHESVDYLLSLGNEVIAMKLGLENIRTLLDELGRPQSAGFVKVQVAGTNGKGSVCAFLNSICIAAGIRVGMFTSPHLVSITERIQIDGREISEDDFARLATRVRETSERLVASSDLDYIPTYFEQVTAIALLAFAEAEIKVAILETGLGGRLDATTAANADIAAITRIDLDHQRYLGDTLVEIAAEKAAIIRSELQNVVIGAQQPDALRVILDRCRSLGVVPNNELFTPWTVESDGPSSVRVETTRGIFPDVTLGLKGKHQIENATTALNVMQSLLYNCGVSFEDDDVIEGLMKARHPGRLESIGRFLLDGAHNSGGARALKNYADEFVSRPITMIFGAMNDKDSAEILSILSPVADSMILTRAENPRSRKLNDLLADVPSSYDPSRVMTAENIGDAIRFAVAGSRPSATILITGSLYLVGEARHHLKSQI